MAGWYAPFLPILWLHEGLAPGQSASKSKHTSETKTARKFHHCQLPLRKPLPLPTIPQSKQWWRNLSICLYAVDVCRNTPASFRLSSWGSCCHLAMAIGKHQFLTGIVWLLVWMRPPISETALVRLGTHTQPRQCSRLEILQGKALFWQVFIPCSAPFPWSLRGFTRLQVAGAEGPFLVPLNFCISRSR